MRRTFTASIYVRHADTVLLVLHKRFNMWVPVGGELEANERPLDGAARELFEETRIKDAVFPALDSALLPNTPWGLMAYEEHDAGSKGWHMNFAFVAKVGSPDVTPNNEFKEYTWWTRDKLPALMPSNVRRLSEMALSI